MVVGGGVAGVSAALAASRSGAETTLVEGSGTLAPDRSAFPYLLSPPRPVAAAPSDAADLEALSESGVEVRLRESVVRVEAGASVAHTGQGRVRFDSVVIATGSRYLADEVRGVSKRGVFVMRSGEDYAALARSAEDVSSVTVLGSAPLSLVVADALSRRSKVRVSLGPRGLPFSRVVSDAVARAAAARGVELASTTVDAVVGAKRVEAVISGGRVHACDAVVVLPKGVPSVPEVGCLKGDHAGLLVDQSMMTSAANVFAAGDCAELKFGCTSLPSRARSSAAAMGEVAGINACRGGMVRARLARPMALEVFGLEVCAVGVDVGEARMAGLDAVEAESSRDGRVTSLVYERSTQRVHGMQTAGTGAIALSESASLAVSSGLRLEDLAYRDSPYLPRFNTGDAPIRLTAGRALSRPRTAA